MSITIRLGKGEEEILRSIVETKNTSMSAYIREIITEKINEEIDRECIKKLLKSWKMMIRSLYHGKKRRLN